MRDAMDLTGKRILVTGASSGIGRATALRIAELGGSVVLVARRQAMLEETLASMTGSGHDVSAFDLRSVDAIGPWLEDLVVRTGKLDGFVHCAGVAPMRPLAMSNPAFLQDTMLVNFGSFLEIARTFSKVRNHQDLASIVGMSSVASRAAEKSRIAYAASKAAMDAAVRVMAQELAPRGIRVNTVQAGLIRTELATELEDRAREGAVAEVVKRQLLGLGDPMDVANMICYLLSDASRFITGTAVVVDGGYLT